MAMIRRRLFGLGSGPPSRVGTVIATRSGEAAPERVDSSVGRQAARRSGSRCYYPPACGGVDARRYVVGIPCLALVAGYVAAHDYVRGAAFVVQAAGMQGIARTVAEWETRDVTEHALTIPWRAGVIPARKYLPQERAAATVPARARRPRLGRGRTAPHRVRARPRVHGTSRRHRRPARSRALHDFAADDRCDRGCRAVAVAAARSGAGRPYRHDGNQLRRRTVDRRRRPSGAAEPRRRGPVDRRARRAAADPALSLHGDPGRRHATAAA